MRYLDKKWTHALSGKAYADGWEATFGKKPITQCKGCGVDIAEGDPVCVVDGAVLVCGRCAPGLPMSPADVKAAHTRVMATHGKTFAKLAGVCRRCADNSEPLHDAECPRYWPGGLGRDIECEGRRYACRGHASAEAHACPFREEIRGDYETLCHCCEACVIECQGDI